jgi:DNA gyrase/topoisomerase IV subunit A
MVPILSNYLFAQAALVEQIAKLVDEGKITGISDIRDESDRDGMRVVVELKRGKHISKAQLNFGMIMMNKYSKLRLRMQAQLRISL